MLKKINSFIDNNVSKILHFTDEVLSKKVKENII